MNKKQVPKKVIDTTGVDVSAPVKETAATKARGKGKDTGKDTGKDKGKDKGKGGPQSKDEAPVERGEPSEAVLEATAAMARAASQSVHEALATADQLDQEILLDTIAFQLPASWITKSVVERLRTIETPALALVISWLAANWWAGYEVGQSETIDSIKKASEKGLRGGADKDALATVEKQINGERERNAREESEQS